MGSGYQTSGNFYDYTGVPLSQESGSVSRARFFSKCHLYVAGTGTPKHLNIFSSGNKNENMRQMSTSYALQSVADYRGGRGLIHDVHVQTQLKLKKKIRRRHVHDIIELKVNYIGLL